MRQAVQPRHGTRPARGALRRLEKGHDLSGSGIIHSSLFSIQERTTMRFRKFFLPLAGVAMMSALAGSAAAHVTVNPDEAAAGSWFRAALRISHGCEGSPTVAVRVKLPDGVFSVKPQVKPGWTIEIKTRMLEQPAEGLHGVVTEVVDEIAWRGGPLPDAYFDEFGLSMKLPNEP